MNKKRIRDAVVSRHKKINVLVVIPTYNEKSNIVELVAKILIQRKFIDVLIVDDNSPDSTGQIADEMSMKNKRIKVIHRRNKMGLGAACVHGFKYGLNKHYDLICEMDADLSHDPKFLNDLIDKSRKYDLVLGSRWTKGGGVVGWAWYRHVASRMANLITRTLFGLKAKDVTTGYRCYNRKILEKMDLNNVVSSGYAFLEEMVYMTQKAGFRIGEIPIIFIDRRLGQSKMSKKEIIDSSKAILKLFVKRYFG